MTEQFELLKKEAVTQIQSDLTSAVEVDRILAQIAKTEAETAKTGAQTAETGAVTAKNQAVVAKEAAETAYIKLPETERVAADAIAALEGRIKSLEEFIKNAVFNSLQGETLSAVKDIILKGAPLIIQGAITPSITPDFVGQFYIDTTAGVTYQAKGITNASDWKATSN